MVHEGIISNDSLVLHTEFHAHTYVANVCPASRGISALFWQKPPQQAVLAPLTAQLHTKHISLQHHSQFCMRQTWYLFGPQSINQPSKRRAALGHLAEA